MADDENKGQSLGGVADDDEDAQDSLEELSSVKKQMATLKKKTQLSSDGHTRAYLGLFMILTLAFVFYYQQIQIERDGIENVRSFSDTDLDGISDTKELEMSGTDPYTADTDGDGVDDLDEIYALTDPRSAANQPIDDRDFDEDGILNGVEIAQGSDPLTHYDFENATAEDPSIIEIGGDENATDKNFLERFFGY
jgi:hypothetical protein